MAKLISYEIDQGLLKMAVDDHSTKFILSPIGNFEVFRYTELAEEYGHTYAMGTHDADKAFSDLANHLVPNYEMQRFVDDIIVRNEHMHA